jgi:hypothetical protein
VISRASTSSLINGFQKSQKLWDQESAQGALVPIATLGASADFTNIPQSFKHLMITGTLRGTSANTIEYGNLTFNGTSSGYSYTNLIGDGSSVVSNRNTPVGNGAFYLGLFPSGNSTAKIFGSFTIYIYNYTNSSYNKTATWHSGTDVNGGGQSLDGAGVWGSTSAINRVTIYGSNGSNALGKISLYGIRSEGQ